MNLTWNRDTADRREFIQRGISEARRRLRQRPVSLRKVNVVTVDLDRQVVLLDGVDPFDPDRERRERAADRARRANDGALRTVVNGPEPKLFIPALALCANRRIEVIESGRRRTYVRTQGADNARP